MKWRRLLRCLAPVLPLVAVSDSSFYAQVPFYQSKTITVIVSSDAGGTSDVRVNPSFLTCRNTFQEIPLSCSSTCPEAAGGKLPIMFSGWQSRTG